MQGELPARGVAGDDGRRFQADEIAGVVFLDTWIGANDNNSKFPAAALVTLTNPASIRLKRSSNT
jgi:hypothetical protein